MELTAVQMWFTFAVIGIAIVALAMENLRLEVTCIAIVVVFMIFFHYFPLPGPDGQNLLDAQVLLAGFATPALVTILALLVIGQGLFHTGALDGPTRALIRMAGSRGLTAIAVTLIIAGLFSAFMNNTPIVVMFIPVISALAGRFKLAPSKTMMSLSFISLLGGMTTLIGSSTNLLVAGVTRQAGLGQIGFFDFTIPGLILAAAGTAYVLFVMPRLLPTRATMAEEVTGHSGKQFIAQITITDGHPLVGARPVAGMFTELKDMTVRMIQRGEHPFLPPFEDFTLQPGDAVIVAATRSVLTEALTARSSVLTVGSAGDEGEEGNGAGTGQLVLAEAVIAPGSRMIGRTIEQSGLRADTGCIVLGIQRRSRMIRMRLSEIRLEAGDVVLVMGRRNNVNSLRFHRDLLLLEWSASELPQTARSRRALAIFIAVVLCAATGILPISIAALGGALIMIPAGCLNVRQAARAFDRQIYLLIGASLAMAAPLQATGGAQFLASLVSSTLQPYGPAVVLSALFALIAILTNVLSNNATAVLFTPIAIDMARQLGIDPMPFVFAVILAANCSFATPIAYQTNLLVMGPGHYRFGDFMRAGLPLVIIMWIVFSLFAPGYYGI